MQPASSTIDTAPRARALAAMLLPLALGVAACGGGGSSADTGSAASAAARTTTTVSADAGSTTTAGADAGSATTAGAETGSTVSDATTKWCSAFRSLDQDPTHVDMDSMLAIDAPRDDLAGDWDAVVTNANLIHATGAASNLTNDYNQLKTFADTYCPK